MFYLLWYHEIVSTFVNPSIIHTPIFAPNSVFLLAFPLKIGLTCGWLILTILPSARCVAVSYTICCWRKSSDITSRSRYCFLLSSESGVLPSKSLCAASYVSNTKAVFLSPSAIPSGQLSASWPLSNNLFVPADDKSSPLALRLQGIRARCR